MKGLLIRTPLVFSPTFSSLTGSKVYLKLETLQLAGSFKVRGAAFRIIARREEIGPQGVIAASAGNHAQGVAVAARLAGVPATVVMPVNSSIAKQEAARGYGARVILYGTNLSESIGRAKELSKDGMTFIHPYDDPDVIAGQGTCGLEILEEIPKPDLVVVPVGGGGLISGIATAVKETHPACRIVGVQSARCPAMYRAIKGEPPIDRTCRSIADGIVVKEPGRITLPIIRKYVDDLVLVDDDQIADAMFLLLERKRVVAEGAGAAPLAALLNGGIWHAEGSTIVLVISGGNVDSALLGRVIRQGQMKGGRILRLYAVLEDIPGELAKLLGIIATAQGNILYIHHMRGERDLPVTSIRMEIELETKGKEHGDKIIHALVSAGYSIHPEDDSSPSRPSL
ncbi:MAG: threonine ammonia-lyase [Methanomicrobiales archaeon]|nr:threonine ammonia-lyase [Methanomicrobiales archaeon]